MPFTAKNEKKKSSCCNQLDLNLSKAMVNNGICNSITNDHAHGKMVMEKTL